MSQRAGITKSKYTSPSSKHRGTCYLIWTNENLQSECSWLGREPGLSLCFSLNLYPYISSSRQIHSQNTPHLTLEPADVISHVFEDTLTSWTRPFPPITISTRLSSGQTHQCLSLQPHSLPTNSYSISKQLHVLDFCSRTGIKTLL